VSGDSELGAAVTAMGIVRAPWQDLLMEHSPDTLAGYLEWSKVARTYDVITPKQRELLVIAIDCALLWPGPYLDQHFARAAELGASVKELIEVVVTAGHIAGPHSMTHGLTALQRVIADGRIPEGNGRSDAS
jgi:alkylhydroperoxidase/carboxymuconolactone decarboxylase family protein YurZ